eukprot:TRINITY_DN1950_c0_g2_i1.p1 TRINITY_DN1950_c0_g2~~TRINITY_DN1950_c0_g2_i1.p1  ORF type:complete len:414 (+),score=59.77 TRINITY_DN1950_c0_g2_i1:69-1310(+)
MSARARSRSPKTCIKCNRGDEDVNNAFMNCAASCATAGVKLQHGGPFGACVVKDGIVVSCAHNSVLLSCDPTCHAEMNAVRQACAALQTHDLSDCELYTTCEPCPMCWGAVQWSRLNKVYIGADRFTAAKYGFDDKVFYDEVESHANSFGLHRYGFFPNSLDVMATTGSPVESARSHKNMLEVHLGVLREEVETLFTCKQVNKTYRRRLGQGTALKKIYEDAFANVAPEHGNGADRFSPQLPSVHIEDGVSSEMHKSFMREAIQAARKAAKDGSSKEREPFGAVIVKDGKVVSSATNSVMQTRDATATAEVNAIRAAAKALGTYDLSACEIYTTAVPDVMSMAACLWARLPRVYCGVSQEFALRFGHEEGWLHFQELMTGRPEDRAIQAVDNVARSACEDVFKFWSSLNGKIY